MSREWDSVLEGFWPAPLSGVHTKLAADSARRRAQALEQQRKAARPTATRPSTAHGARRSRAVRGGLKYLFASAATKPELPALPGGEPLQDRSSQRLFVAREKHPWPKAARQPQSCADQRRFLPPSTSFSVLQEALLCTAMCFQHGCAAVGLHCAELSGTATVLLTSSRAAPSRSPPSLREERTLVVF